MRRSQGERPGPHPAALRAALLRWFRKHRRDLPFRRTRDPWAVWLSETVLQQTTVAAGAPRFERLLARFPTVEALASADERELLAAWSGLGYYARARNLHRAARLVAERGGLVPRTVDELRALPGVGPYTAAAVASLAFVLAVAVGGFFYPLAGFAVALVMAVAVAMTLFRPRSFCAKACPRNLIQMVPFTQARLQVH